MNKGKKRWIKKGRREERGKEGRMTKRQKQTKIDKQTLWRETPLSLMLWWVWKCFCLERKGASHFGKSKESFVGENQNVGSEDTSYSKLWNCPHSFYNVYWTGMLRLHQSNRSNQEIKYLQILEKAKFKKHIGWCDWNNYLLETSLLSAETILN